VLITLPILDESKTDFDFVILLQVFTLEELRERKTYTYANRIQRFFTRYALEYYFYLMRKEVNDKLRGKKDRRRMSLERPFNTDYINFRENATLKGIVGRDGTFSFSFSFSFSLSWMCIVKFSFTCFISIVKIHFADNCWGIEKGKRVRRTIVITAQYVFIVQIVPNKDKNKELRKQKPFIMITVRKFPPTSVSCMDHIRIHTFSLCDSVDLYTICVYSFIFRLINDC
jgi:hypothetical protein